MSPPFRVPRSAEPTLSVFMDYLTKVYSRFFGWFSFAVTLRLLIGSGVLLLVACKTQMVSVPNAIPVAPARVEVIPVPGQVTEVTVHMISPRSYDQAKHQALANMTQCLQYDSSAGSQGVLWMLICAPINGLLGGISGMLAEAPAEPADITALEATIKDTDSLLEKLLNVSLVANQQFVRFDLLRPLPDVSSDYRVELGLQQLELQVENRPQGVWVTLSWDLDVALRRRDNKAMAGPRTLASDLDQ